MKRIILLLAATFIFSISFGQWTPSTFSETTYSNVFPSANHHNVGTDTRSGASGYGNSPLYANYLNVTVSDYQIAADGRSMFWESSHGTNGSLNLPFDALDPDVVLVEGSSPLSVWAIVVYCSAYAANPGTPGYYMSCSQFIASPYEFNPFLAPVLIDTFTPTSKYKACINIDSDNRGNYAIVYQKFSAIESRTASLVGPTPPAPANAITYNNLMRPDVSISEHSSLDIVKIVSIKKNRNRYMVHTRQMGPISGSSYLSPLLPKLNWPRIASPTQASTQFAITMMQRDTASNKKILFNTFNGITPSGLKVINDGSEGAPYPGDISMYRNVYPAITYHSYLGAEKITVAWHARRILGSPNLNNSFAGLDIDPTTLDPITPNVYLDMSYVNTLVNNKAGIALSGRFTDWCKTTAFAYGSSLFNPTTLVWKYIGSYESGWKNAPGEDNAITKKATESNLIAYPNPATEMIHIDVVKNISGFNYEIFNQQGQSIMKNNASDDKISIPVKNLANGIYYLQLQDKETKEVSQLKFLKE